MAVGKKATFPCCAAVLFACLLLASPAAAAPPANDNFAGAQAVSGTNVTVNGSNVGATKQTDEPAHAGDVGGASIWYTWTAPSNGTYLISTCGSDFDTLLGVYTGNGVGALQLDQVGASDDSVLCGSQSRVRLEAVNGTAYKIAVDGYRGDADSPETGAVQLHIDKAAAPANDNFSAPIALGSTTENDLTGTNIGATRQAGEPDHNGDPGGASVWYWWTAPVSGKLVIGACYANFESRLTVYTGSTLGSLQQIASDSCNYGSGTRFNAVQGTSYRISVDGDSGYGTHPPETGDFELVTHMLFPPPNDDFANAQLLSGISAQGSANTTDATVESGEPAHFSGGPYASAWYRWTAPADGQLTLSTCGSDFDTVLAVYTGNAVGALNRIAGNDDAPNCSPASRVILDVKSGTTYRIAVDGHFDYGDAVLNLSLTAASQAFGSKPKDSEAPNSKIKKVVVDDEHGKAKLTFGSSEPGSKFECKLDKAKYKSCHSPKTFRHLDAGKHKVKVLATDAAGNSDPTPAVRKFKIAP